MFFVKIGSISKIYTDKQWCRLKIFLKCSGKCVLLLPSLFSFMYKVKLSYFNRSDFSTGFHWGPWGGSGSSLWESTDSGRWVLRRQRWPPRVASPVAVAAVRQWGRPAGSTGLPGAQHPAEHQSAAGAAVQRGDGQRGCPEHHWSCWGLCDPGGEGVIIILLMGACRRLTGKISYTAQINIWIKSHQHLEINSN